MIVSNISRAAALAACLAACSAPLPPPPPLVAAPAPVKPAENVPAKPAEPPAKTEPKIAEAPNPPVAPPKAAAKAPVPPRAPAPAPAPAKAAPPAPVAKAPAPAPAPLDLRSLEQRLRDTNAIGVLTKLTLKNQVDDLVARFRVFHEGQRPPTLADLRPAFELLLMKVLSLLQDHDTALAKDINASRDAIWNVLADREKLGQYLR